MSDSHREVEKTALKLRLMVIRATYVMEAVASDPRLWRQQESGDLLRSSLDAVMKTWDLLDKLLSQSTDIEPAEMEAGMRK